MAQIHLCSLWPSCAFAPMRKNNFFEDNAMTILCGQLLTDNVTSVLPLINWSINDGPANALGLCSASPFHSRLSTPLFCVRVHFAGYRLASYCIIANAISMRALGQQGMRNCISPFRPRFPLSFLFVCTWLRYLADDQHGIRPPPYKSLRAAFFAIRLPQFKKARERRMRRIDATRVTLDLVYLG